MKSDDQVVLFTNQSSNYVKFYPCGDEIRSLIANLEATCMFDPECVITNAVTCMHEYILSLGCDTFVGCISFTFLMNRCMVVVVRLPCQSPTYTFLLPDPCSRQLNSVILLPVNISSLHFAGISSSTLLSSTPPYYPEIPIWTVREAPSPPSAHKQAVGLLW